MGTITRGFANLITASGPSALPAGLAVNTPAFFADLSSNQTITTSTFTKVQFNNEILDSDSNYDNATNYRFTPTTAGKYFVYLQLQLNATATNSIQEEGPHGPFSFFKSSFRQTKQREVILHRIFRIV